MYPTKISHKDSEMYQNKIEKMIINFFLLSFKYIYKGTTFGDV